MLATTTLLGNLPADAPARQSRTWLSVREAARVLRLPQHRVVALARHGVLYTRLVDRHWWLLADSVRGYARRHRRQRTHPGSVARRPIVVADRVTGISPAQGDLFRGAA